MAVRTSIHFILYILTFSLRVTEPSKQMSLYKCQSSEWPQNSLVLPPSLRVSYSEEKYYYFSEKYEALFNFTLMERDPRCEDTFDLEIPIYVEPDQNPKFNFTPDGYLFYQDQEEGDEVTDEIYFHSENYCIANVTSEFIYVRACKSQCSMREDEKGSSICIPKCCQLGYALSEEQDCVKTLGYDSPIKMSIDQNYPVYPQYQFNEHQWHWHCPNDLPNATGWGQAVDDLRISMDGRIWSRTPLDKWLPIHKNHRGGSRSVCVDNIGSTMDPKSTDSQVYIITCKEEEEENKILRVSDRAKLILKWQAVLFLIASLIYLIPIVLYGLLWEFQNNAHGYTIFSLSCINFLFAGMMGSIYSAYGFGQSIALHSYLKPLCNTIGITNQFLQIARFSWTTVLSFDVWSKIRSVTPSSNLSSKKMKRFLLYCAVGHGLPAVMTGIGVTMEFGTGEEEGLIRPGYSKVSCVILDPWTYIIYVGGVIIILFGMNMTFVLLTLSTVLQSKMRIRGFIDAKKSSCSTDNSVSLMIKLFVMMGIFLVVQLVLAFVALAKMEVWLIVLINLECVIHAAGYVWITVWNKKIRSQLTSKFDILRRVAESLTSTTPLVGLKETSTTKSGF